MATAKETADERDDDADDLPEAKVVDNAGAPARGLARIYKVIGFVFFVVLGWMFIIATNKFHITAPVVFVCLGFLAVTVTVLNLWRTGAAAVAPDVGVEDWGRPLGARVHLEKEKRTLLKAIKEAEFDLAMGKLSKVDCDSLIRDYRTRAIEVIKEIERIGDGATLSTKEQIQREVRARIALDLSDKPSNRAKNAAAKKANKGKPVAEAAKVEAEAATTDPEVAKPEAEATKAEVAEPAAEAVGESS